MSRSDKLSVFSMTSPLSLARCSREMKQYEVEMSSITDLGYTDWRPVMTSLNLSVVSAGCVES